MGTYHNISKEHTCSIIQAALDNAHATQKRFNKALTSKAEEKRNKEKIGMRVCSGLRLQMGYCNA